MGLLIAAFVMSWTGGLFAQSVGDIHVRTVALRPGCAIPEGYVETYNCSDLCYRLRVKRDYKKDASSTTCTGCTAVCGGIYPSDTCSTRVDSDSDPLAAIQLGPVGSATFCLPAQDCLPSATCLPCDNRNMTTSCGAKTCNTANEWCSAYTSVEVKIVEYATFSHGQCRDWQTLGSPLVVCASGIYAGGGVPTCPSDSYCSLPYGQRVMPRAMCSGWTRIQSGLQRRTVLKLAHDRRQRPLLRATALRSQLPARLRLDHVQRRARPEHAICSALSVWRTDTRSVLPSA
jgi:hypothetical protein